MKSYLVGGAVRDRLLGLEPRERDWLVTGTTPEQLQQDGFQQVGRDFPVFLHPRTREEYALPRTARSSPGNGTVSVEEDLARRDLTINAMALDSKGNLIDPCGGAHDLELRLLRHTPAFSDDPIRVLRLARFAARYHALGFRIADDTRGLARKMVRRGELDRLVPERVFAEISKALTEEQPDIFFRELRACEALAAVIPELDRLFGIPQPEKYHPEIDSGIHSLLTLEQAAKLSPDPQVRYAALLHDLGKGSTPVEEWPRHIGHEHRGAPLVNLVSRRLRVPNEWNLLAQHVARLHLDCHRAMQLRSGTILKMLRRLDVLRNQERFERFLLACHADLLGRPGQEHTDYPQAGLLRCARDAALAVDAASLVQGMTDGAAIAEKLDQARSRAIGKAIKVYKSTLDNEPPYPAAE
jgi:tRNA nucleotidyltransferase (CCA-adding enzyme)